MSFFFLIFSSPLFSVTKQVPAPKLYSLAAVVPRQSISISSSRIPCDEKDETTTTITGDLVQCYEKRSLIEGPNSSRVSTLLPSPFVLFSSLLPANL